MRMATPTTFMGSAVAPVNPVTCFSRQMELQEPSLAVVVTKKSLSLQAVVYIF